VIQFKIGDLVRLSNTPTVSWRSGYAGRVGRVVKVYLPPHVSDPLYEVKIPSRDDLVSGYATSFTPYWNGVEVFMETL
jgi:hypothetical protein